MPVAEDGSSGTGVRGASPRLLVYVAALAIGTAGVAVAVSGEELSDLWALVLLAGLAVLAERGTVQLAPNLQVSVSLVPLLLAAVALGPPAAMLVGGASMAGDRDGPALRWLTYALSRAITGGLAGLAATAVENGLGREVGAIALATLAAAATAQTLDATFASLTLAVRRTGGPADVVPVLPMLAVSAALYVPVVAALVLAWERLSPWTLVLFLVPAAAAHRLYTLYHRERRLAAEVAVANASLERRDAILEAVAGAARRFLEASSTDEALPQLLGDLGRAAEAEHVCAFEQEADGSLRLRSAWARTPGSAAPGPEELDAVAPVPVGWERFGVLGLAGGEWSAAELDGVHAAAGILGAAIERARTEEQLRARDEQLRQSQKLEAIGRLAGGIAHDFNNLLTAIGGYAEMLVGSLDADDPRRADAAEVRDAALRASSLTGQLLAFGRKQVLAPEVIDVNAALIDAKRLLERVLGEHVELELELEPDLAPIIADPIQLHQIVLNLAVNARDAMPAGGRLRLRTGNVDAAPAHGPMVLLEVADEGEGMDAATLEHAFEPFFTTKGPGSGTGLGLATVHGIVEQSRGRVEVESEPGRGTVFRVYLPAGDDVESALPEPQEAPAGGSETILLVEDEAKVRQLAARILRERGYTVVEAADAEEALALSDDGTAIDLLLTDVVMPGLGGGALAERLSERRLFTSVVFMTGYAEDAVVHRGLSGRAASSLLPKPFTADGLARAVRDALDGAKPPQEPGAHEASRPEAP